MSRRALATAALGAFVALLVVVRSRRRPRVWVGLHLQDGMLLTLAADEPEVPSLRAAAGDLIRELRPGSTTTAAGRSDSVETGAVPSP